MFTLPQLHLSEKRRLLEGLAYLNEQEHEAIDAAGEGDTIERHRRKEGRKARARQRFAERRGLV